MAIPANARPIYAQKTVERRGAPMQMDDTSKLTGYMVDNGDGTYSNYTPEGQLERTYKANTGFANGLSQTLDSIVSDKSGVLSNFVAPALAMGYGANLVNGGGLIAEAAGAGEAAAAGGGGGGLITSGPFAGLTEAELAAANAAASATSVGTGAGLGSMAAAAGKGLLSNPSLLAAGAGALIGAAGSKDTTTTSSKDPWGPAQPYLIDNLKRNAAMQDYYAANPFSQEQKTAYQGLLNTVANGQANAPVMSGIANNFMQSRRGQMAPMPQFVSGTQAAPVNWDAYKNIGLLKG